MLCSFCFVFPSVSFLFLCFMGFLIIFDFYLFLNFHFLLEAIEHLVFFHLICLLLFFYLLYGKNIKDINCVLWY